ncbi:unnamed protein product [Rotaria sordida]|uniref:Caspase family p20 domain-containing protein n=1 Tax=Rotaria sordida TaxID=392033 RepID=A0A819QWA1_9BILA|nr:unnamed protein product [Rotaria sordida]CAF1445730.1 unnamed protein product [Rotaria sordida]CAF4012483.1 unnamed protein product [Rotaria sordida]CAF4035070.1 unnamed protein product [Rotaria sordida]
MATPKVESSNVHRKLALVIGNQNYTRKPLRNPEKDAKDLAYVLGRIGFDVELSIDCTCETMAKLIDSFADRIEDQDLILFYFAGHGFQYKQQNYLIPVDTADQLGGPTSLKSNAINAQATLDQLKSQTSYVTIFILDCCREPWTEDNNTFRNLGDRNGGLFKMTAPGGSIIQFACAPDKLAADGASQDENGLFTKHLLQHIGKPNQDLEVMLRIVTSGVYKESGGKQQPYRESGLMIDEHLYLNTGECKYVS